MDDRTKDIDIRLYIGLLKRQKKLIAAITGGAAVLSAVISMLLPNYYAATASVMPQSQDSSMAAIAASALPTGLSGVAGSLLGSDSKSDLWAGILNSNSVRDEIIRKFDLRNAYGEDTIEETREELDGLVTVNKGKDSIVSVTIEDKDPQKAAAMANAFVAELDKINKSVVMTTGKSMRLFVEQRLNETKAELSATEERMRAFQKRNKAVKLDAQSEALIKGLGELKGELMAKEIQLQTLLTFATDTNPQVQLLRAEVTGLKEQLRETETGGTEANLFIPTKNLPDIGLEYVRLLRDSKVQETLFEFLTQQYEMARIQEVKDSPTVQVLDMASVPEKKSSPKRSLIVLLSTFFAAFFSLFFVLTREFLSNLKGS